MFRCARPIATFSRIKLIIIVGCLLAAIKDKPGIHEGYARYWYSGSHDL